MNKKFIKTKNVKRFCSLMDELQKLPGNIPKSYEEFEEILKDKNLHSKKLEKDLQKVLFLCELQGRSDRLDE